MEDDDEYYEYINSPEFRNVKRKYDKTYTQQDLDAYLLSLNDCKDIDNAWRTLGYINASAYKAGEGENIPIFKDGEKKYNKMVYSIKEKALNRLIELGGVKITSVLSQKENKSYLVDWETGFYEEYELHTYILYVRLSDGVQLSFHKTFTLDGYEGDFDLKKNDALYNAFVSLKGDCQWDGILEAYRYSGKEYKQMLMQLKEAKRKAVVKFKEYFGKRVSGIQNFITEVVCDGKAIRVRVPKKSMNKQFLLEDL